MVLTLFRECNARIHFYDGVARVSPAMQVVCIICVPSEHFHYQQWRDQGDLSGWS